MPRYFFHITDGAQELRPPRGVDLLGDAAAREEAVRLAYELRRSETSAGASLEGWFIRITDAEHREIDSVPLDLANDEPLPP